jgi:hypothetical protein
MRLRLLQTNAGVRRVALFRQKTLWSSFALLWRLFLVNEAGWGPATGSSG